MGGDRLPVEGAFQLAARNSVRFRLGAYDHEKPLVIDPILSYSTYVGGTDATGMAVDAAGELFITGSCGNEFPTTPGAFQPVDGFTADIDLSTFVAKLSSDGSYLVYATYLSGTSQTDIAFSNGIAIDSAGNAYVAGFTDQDDFPTTPGAFQTANKATFSAGTTGFVSKLNSTGAELVYSTYIGGSISTNPTNLDTPEDSVNAITVDASGDAFITGSTISKDFPVTAGSFQTSLVAANMLGTAFVAEINPSGSGLVFATYLGGSVFDQGLGIAIDPSGNAIVGGVTASADFPLTPNAIQSSNKAEAGAETGFVTKVNSTGNSLVYSTYLGGSFSDQVDAVAVDGAGSAYVTGVAISRDFPVTPNAFQNSTTGVPTAYIAKINSGGTALDYSTYLGGGGGDAGAAIAVDSSGDAYVTGSTSSSDFPVTPGAFVTQNYSAEINEESNPFLSEIDSSGTGLIYSTYLGGGDDWNGGGGGAGNSVALDPFGNVFVAGITSSEDFPTTPGAYMTNLVGVIPSTYAGESVFVTEFNGSEMKAIPLSTTNITSSANPQLPGNSVSFTAQVAPVPGGATPTGLIGFDLDYYIWTTAPLDLTGSAVYTPPIKSINLGQHVITATYLGDSNNAPSTAAITENIAYYPTTTAITASTNNAPWDTPVTFTATVTSTPPTPVPAGAVTFVDANSEGSEFFQNVTVPLDGKGNASMTTSLLQVGLNDIYAEYVANDNLHATSQGLVVETILAPPAPPSPVFAPSPGNYNSSQTVTISDATSGVAICYTTNGTQQGTSCGPYSVNLYTGPISVTQTTTIQAVAVAGFVTPSPVVTAVYSIDGVLPGFTISSTPVTVSAGGSITNTSSIVLTSTGGFSGRVALTAAITSSPAGAVEPPVLSFGSTSPVSITGVSAGVATLTITTTAATSAALAHPRRRPGVSLYASGGATLACILLFGIPARRRSWRTVLGMFVLLVIVSGGVFACGGDGAGGGGGGGGTSNPGTTAGNYTITVTGTSGSTTATGTVALTVN